MEKKVLVVVDYQKDFVNGSLGFNTASDMDIELSQHVKAERENGAIIVATLDTHNEKYLETQEGKRLPIIHTVEDTDGHELFGLTGTEIKSGDHKEVRKDTFGSITLMQLLQDLDATGQPVGEVELCGVVTNMCVISNAIAAKMALTEARVVVNAGLCASNDNELHEKALDVMKSMQIDVINENKASECREMTQGQELYAIAMQNLDKLGERQVERLYKDTIAELRKEALKGKISSSIYINAYDLIATDGKYAKLLIKKLKDEGIKAGIQTNPGGEYGEDSVYLNCEILQGNDKKGR